MAAAGRRCGHEAAHRQRLSEILKCNTARCEAHWALGRGVVCRAHTWRFLRGMRNRAPFCESIFFPNRMVNRSAIVTAPCATEFASNLTGPGEKEFVFRRHLTGREAHFLFLKARGEPTGWRMCVGSGMQGLRSCVCGRCNSGPRKDTLPVFVILHG